MSQSMNVAESPSTDPNASGVMPGKDAVHRPSAMRAELAMVWTLWRRDMLRLKRERSRWLGVMLQPRRPQRRCYMTARKCKLHDILSTTTNWAHNNACKDIWGWANFAMQSGKIS